MYWDRLVQTVAADAPLHAKLRVVAGPWVSRETLKDVYLRHRKVLPARAIGTFGDLAKEILGPAARTAQPPLDPLSQIDAVNSIARNAHFKSAFGELAPHVASRPVAKHVAALLTELDAHFTGDLQQLDALLEIIATKDPGVAEVMGFFTALWKGGIFWPWSPSEKLRQAAGKVRESGVSFSKLILVGFDRFTPVEESLVSALSETCEVEGWQPERLEQPRPACIETVHSSVDEIEMVLERLLAAPASSQSEFGIFVPSGELGLTYKRKIRSRLEAAGIPLQDPTLPDAWRDTPEAVYCQDFLAAVASSLNAEDVIALVAPELDDAKAKRLHEILYRSGQSDGAKIWRYVQRETEISSLARLLDGQPLLLGAKTPTDFADAFDAVAKLVPEKPAEIFQAFAEHLRSGRPILSTGGAVRVTKLLPVFEEFLGAWSRKNSKRNSQGVWLATHGVWIPKKLKHAFVLGARGFARELQKSVFADLWNERPGDTIPLLVRMASAKLDSGVKDEREIFFDFSLDSHDRLHFFCTTYDFFGKEFADSDWFSRRTAPKKGDNRSLGVAHGHLASGWLANGSPAKSKEVRDPKALAIALPAFTERGEIRVSQFEDYLICPFLFYGRHVKKVEPLRLPGLSVDPRLRGELLHKIFERALKETDLSEQSVAGIVTEEVDKRMAVRPVFEGLYRDTALIKQFTSLLQAQARQWASWERARREEFPELKPALFEESVELPIELGGGKRATLRGKIDRVDQSKDFAVVIDYKTGTPKFIGGEMLRGQGVQLMAYAEAVRRKLGLEPAAAFYLTVGRSKVISRDGFYLKKYAKRAHAAHARNSGLSKSETFDEVFSVAEAKWKEALIKLNAGEFTASPARPKDCTNCDFKKVCGYFDE